MNTSTVKSISLTLLLLLVACGSQEVMTSVHTPDITPIGTIASLIPSPVPAISHNPLQPTPQDIIGGGTMQDGPFTFLLWLFRDPTLSLQPVTSSLYSDLDGIGVYLHWVYEGENSIGPVETFGGSPQFLMPFPMGTFARIESGSSGGRTGGIILGGGYGLPAEIKVGDQISLLLKVVTADGEYGAWLNFTIEQGPNGFDFRDISIETIESSDN